MPITASNPFKGRQHPGELIILCVRLYLRYPLSYEHVAELIAERGVEVDASCIWRWFQAYAPELNKRCRPDPEPVCDGDPFAIELPSKKLTFVALGHKLFLNSLTISFRITP